MTNNRNQENTKILKREVARLRLSIEDSKNKFGEDIFNAPLSVWINFLYGLPEVRAELYNQLDQKGAWAPQPYLDEFKKHQMIAEFQEELTKIYAEMHIANETIDYQKKQEYEMYQDIMNGIIIL